ncbi:MAG: hypothetical protein ACK5V3_05250 [Bdellovibrionales bacterium]
MNIKSKSLFLLVSFLSLYSQADIVTSHDAKNNCTAYRIPRDSKPIQSDEKLFIEKPVYGLSLQNAKVNFENKTVEVDILVRIVLGLNSNLTTKPVTIKPENKNFEFLLNQLNRSVFLFEKVCISETNELIWADFFEPEPTTNKTN